MGQEDFRKIPNGTGGIEDRMSVLWHHGVRSGRLTPSEFVAATSTNAARLFNLFPRKGTLTVGADADLVIWDPEKSRTISVETNHSHPAMDFNIYEGMTVTGNAATTLSRGRVVWENGRLDVEKGFGRYLPRPCFGPLWDAALKGAKR
jgi:dihydropyrimidinase